MKPVACALIGVGMMGSEHAAVLARSPLAELAVACDLDAAAAERLAPGTAFTTDLDEALDRPGLEAAFVCTPQALHRAHVEAALARGLAVFCEKPLAASLEDADAIIAAAGDATLVVGHMLRFDPRYRALADADLGEIAHATARRNVPDFEGRLLRDRTTLAGEVLVHDLDVLRWLVGEPERVYAESGGAGEARALVATLRFASGAVASVEANWAMPSQAGLPSDYRLSLVGTAGAAYLELRDEGVAVFTPAGTAFPRSSDTVRIEVEHFLMLLRGGEPWPLELHDARAALACAIALDRSAAEARPVALAEVG